MALLAAALPQLQLERGIPLPASEATPGASLPEITPAVTISISTFFKSALAIILILTLVVGAYKLLRGARWKDILGPILLFTVTTLVILGILAILVNVHVTFNPQQSETLPPAVPVPSAPAGPLPLDFTWLAATALAAGVVGLGLWLVLHKSKPIPTGEALQLEAERALYGLRAGLDLKDVIIECYLQMSRALQKERGIELEETMTAREFEKLLEGRGFPQAPVHQLTLLFEGARYGSRPPDAGDEQKALDCLAAIVQYCREGGQPG
jgi:hypothetical protein